MKKPIITMIRHHYNSVELLDNAAAYLTRRGFEVRHRYPFDGDLLPTAPDETTPCIVLGGSQNITEIHKHAYLENELRWIEACLASDKPLLGICLGGQLLAHTLGARIRARRPAECEFGFYEVHPTGAGSEWLPHPMHFMQAHFEEFELPKTAELLASSDRYNQQAFRYGEQAYGLQFHPEVNPAILDNWLQDEWSVAMLATQGAQSVEYQMELSKRYLAPQQTWFEGMLDTLFVETDTAHDA